MTAAGSACSGKRWLVSLSATSSTPSSSPRPADVADQWRGGSDGSRPSRSRAPRRAVRHTRRPVPWRAPPRRAWPRGHAGRRGTGRCGKHRRARIHAAGRRWAPLRISRAALAGWLRGMSEPYQARLTIRWTTHSGVRYRHLPLAQPPRGSQLKRRMAMMSPAAPQAARTARSPQRSPEPVVCGLYAARRASARARTGKILPMSISQ